MNDSRQNKPICVRCTVSGRVQGVFFRASAKHQAETLGITGYARNLADGRVEVVACGVPHAVRQMQDWLRQGPPGAEVSGIACEVMSFHAPGSFTTS